MAHIPNFTLHGTVLVVDDDPDYLDVMARLLQQEGHGVLRAPDGMAALELLEQEDVDAVVTDLQMPGADGIAVLRAAGARTPPVPAVIVTGYGTARTAVEAMKLGAVDYVLKPVEPQDLQICVHQALERRRMLAGGTEGADETGFGGLLGASPAMQEVFDQIRRVAPFRSTVLITGTSGTGKELVAQAIHALSAGSEGPFLAMNCSTLPRDLVESQLFGHEKGAFTGAVGLHRGFFEAADKGTLFLDEIGELSPEAQVKLLRVLEDYQVMRLGSTRSISVNVRLLVATNTDLQAAVQEGRFREDLYYRLNVLTISLPLLCERREDIPLLVRVFLDRFARENRVLARELTPQVLECLVAHAWPGNVRELKNMAERLTIMARGETIQVADLPDELRQVAGDPGPAESVETFSTLNMEEIEKAVIHRAMEQARGNRTQAAPLLGISLRTLQRKLRDYGDEVAGKGAGQ